VTAFNAMASTAATTSTVDNSRSNSNNSHSDNDKHSKHCKQPMDCQSMELDALESSCNNNNDVEVVKATVPTLPPLLLVPLQQQPPQQQPHYLSSNHHKKKKDTKDDDDASKIKLGICSMDKKARSKPMAEILSWLNEQPMLILLLLCLCVCRKHSRVRVFRECVCLNFVVPVVDWLCGIAARCHLCKCLNPTYRLTRRVSFASVAGTVVLPY
jgi:hypothetical protein